MYTIPIIQLTTMLHPIVKAHCRSKALLCVVASRNEARQAVLAADLSVDKGRQASHVSKLARRQPPLVQPSRPVLTLCT